jgi:hypothetical protein
MCMWCSGWSMAFDMTGDSMRACVVMWCHVALGRKALWVSHVVKSGWYLLYSGRKCCDRYSKCVSGHFGSGCAGVLNFPSNASKGVSTSDVVVHRPFIVSILLRLSVDTHLMSRSDNVCTDTVFVKAYSSGRSGRNCARDTVVFFVATF